MQKRVLMLNASHNDERLIHALKRLKCYVITTGNRPALRGHQLADEYYYGDYTDLDAMLKLAKEKKIDAICPCCNDFGVITAAYVSEKMGFSGQDNYETTLTIHHKDRFKEFAKQFGIVTPYATVFTSEERALNWAGEVKEFPVIVKPTDLSAGNGIQRVDTVQQLKVALHRAFQTSRIGHVIVEPFIEGTQHGFCTYLINQKVVAVCSNNEYSFINPYRVESDTYPAEHVDAVKDYLIAQIETIAKELKLVDGIFHLQYKLSGGRVYILECMRRVLGNLYSIPAECHGEGFNWDYWEVRAKCGFGCDGFPSKVSQSGFWAYRALISDRDGIYRGYEIPDDIKSQIYDSYMLKQSGDAIRNCGSDPIGFLFLKFNSAEQMKKMIYDRHTQIKIIVQE